MQKHLKRYFFCHEKCVFFIYSYLKQKDNCNNKDGKTSIYVNLSLHGIINIYL